MKKALIFLSIIAVIIFSFPSCSAFGTSDVRFLNEFIWCNTSEAGDDFGLQIMYLYKGSKPTVEFSRFDNSDATAMLKNTEETTENKSYKGYTAVIISFYFDFSSLPAGEEIKINSATFMVNNEEETIDLKDRITIGKISNDKLYFCDSVFSTNIPFVMLSQGKDIEAVSFNYHTENKVTIEKFEFSDYLNITSSQVYVNGTSAGSIEEAFPLSVDADKNISIEINANYGDYNSFSTFLTDAVLYYNNEEEGDRILKDLIVVQAVGNFDSLCSFIDHVLDAE